MRLSFANPLEHLNGPYNPGELVLRRKICRFLLKHIGFTLLAQIERVEGHENVPKEGPAILMMNHIAFIDPLVLVYVMARDIVPLAKVEAYDYPFVGIFPRLWGVIPVQRDGIDRRAVQLALDILRAGEILLVAPEGTRNDALQPPREGAVYLASRSGAPIIPVAIEGTSGYPAIPFSSRWHNSGARVKIGKPFRIRAKYRRARAKELKLMADESMYVLAGMLPPERRGVFRDLSKATQDMIEWV